jgi:hypothetical protein
MTPRPERIAEAFPLGHDTAAFEAILADPRRRERPLLEIVCTKHQGRLARLYRVGPELAYVTRTRRFATEATEYRLTPTGQVSANRVSLRASETRQRDLLVRFLPPDEFAAAAKSVFWLSAEGERCRAEVPYKWLAEQLDRRAARGAIPCGTA